MGKRSVKITTYNYASSSSLVDRRNKLYHMKRDDLPIFSYEQLANGVVECGHDGRKVQKFETLFSGRAFLTLDEITELSEYNITFLSWKNDILP